jgi:hypothetical protein
MFFGRDGDGFLVVIDFINQSLKVLSRIGVIHDGHRYQLLFYIVQLNVQFVDGSLMLFSFEKSVKKSRPF